MSVEEHKIMPNGGAPRGEQGAALPDWLTAILADPLSNQHIELPKVASLQDLSEQVRYARIGQVAYLLAMSPKELFAMKPFHQDLPDVVDHSCEALRPTQARFRKLLGRFANSLPADSIIADLACNDAEFAYLFAHCRYIGMDLWPGALELAISLKSIGFGVVADVRRPPVLRSSLDALVSTATLVHLPPDQVPGAARNLLTFVKPGGRVAMTVPHEFVAAILQDLPPQYRLVEREVTQGPAERSWAQWITRRTSGLILRVGSGKAACRIAAVQNRLAGAFNVFDRVLYRLGIGTFTLDWLVFERIANG
jgi:Methyltransferase domain